MNRSLPGGNSGTSKCTKAWRLDEATVPRTYLQVCPLPHPQVPPTPRSQDPRKYPSQAPPPRLSWAPTPAPSFPKKRFYFLWSTVGISHYFLVPGLLGRGWSPGGPLGGGPCAVFGGVWGQVWGLLALAQPLRTALSCLGLSIPTGPLAGDRAGGLRVLGKSSTSRGLKYFGTVA